MTAGHGVTENTEHAQGSKTHWPAVDIGALAHQYVTVNEFEQIAPPNSQTR
jgi:hypothetical protein